MATQWLRLWHDMPNDPKWRTIARVSKQPISLVISTYLHVLVNASNATERGRTHSLEHEDIASALDVESDQIQQILAVMQGRVMDGDRLTGWEKRQPIREDDSASRAKAWREEKKAEAERTRTQPNAEERPDTDTDKDTDIEKNPLTPLSAVADVAAPKDEAKAKRQTAQFDRFWDAWPKSPRKVGKAACEKKWKALTLDSHASAILAHIQAMCQTQQWRDGFEPAPATYLNQRRWEDGIPQDREADAAGAQGASPWWESSSGIEQKGAELGVKKRAEWNFPTFKVHVFKAAGPGKWQEVLLADLLRTKSSHYAGVYEFFNGNPPLEAA